MQKPPAICLREASGYSPCRRFRLFLPSTGQNLKKSHNQPDSRTLRGGEAGAEAGAGAGPSLPGSAAVAVAVLASATAAVAGAEVTWACRAAGGPGVSVT